MIMMMPPGHQQANDALIPGSPWAKSRNGM
jgi:hypothetical protein